MNEELYKRIESQHLRAQLDHYLQYELWTWQWWFLFGLTVASWSLWLIFRDRNKQARLLLGGLFIGLIAVIADLIGTYLGVWRYNIRLFPTLPSFAPYDVSLLPVQFMFLSQFSRTTRRFFLWSIVLAALNAFIAEPLFEFLNIYQPIRWREIYSFPIYFLYFWMATTIANLTGWSSLHQEKK